MTRAKRLGPAVDDVAAAIVAVFHPTLSGRIRPTGRHVDLDAATLAKIEAADRPLIYVADAVGQVEVALLVLVCRVVGKRRRHVYVNELHLTGPLAPGPCAVRLRRGIGGAL